MDGATLNIAADRPTAARPVARSSTVLLLVGTLLGLALAVVPLFIGGYYLTLATEILIAAVFAVGLNLLIGYTGMVSLGHAMFYGLGGYGVAVGTTLMHAPLWLSVIATVVVMTLVSAVVGVVCTRTKGVQFLLITLAFSQMVYGAAIRLPYTNRSDGLSGVPRPDLSFLNLDSGTPSTFYGYVLAVFLVCLFCSWRIVRSPFGSVLIGIKESERRTVSMGYSVGWYKVGAFVLSGVIASVAGILQAQYTFFVSPDSMTWQMGGEGVLLVIIGGVGTILGPLAGAGVFVLVKQGLSAITQEYLLFFGIFFMFVVAFFRGGVVGALEDLRRRWFK